jgi:hypothetical protein
VVYLKNDSETGCNLDILNTGYTKTHTHTVLVMKKTSLVVLFCFLAWISHWLRGDAASRGAFGLLYFFPEWGPWPQCVFIMGGCLENWETGCNLDILNTGYWRDIYTHCFGHHVCSIFFCTLQNELLPCPKQSLVGMFSFYILRTVHVRFDNVSSRFPLLAVGLWPTQLCCCIL